MKRSACLTDILASLSGQAFFICRRINKTETLCKQKSQKENREVYRRGFEKYREIYKRLKDLM